MSDPIRDGLSGAARVMLGEGRAARSFDGTSAAARASFLGLAIAFFVNAGILSANETADARIGEFLRLLVLDVASYAAAVATILVLTREPQHRARFSAWFAAQNWAEAVLAAAFAVPQLVLVSLPKVRVEGAQVIGYPLLTTSIVVGVVVLSFVARYRLLVHVLGVGGVRAFWMVAAAVAAATVVTAVLA